MHAAGRVHFVQIGTSAELHGPAVLRLSTGQRNRLPDDDVVGRRLGERGEQRED
jgi:hypothetical protein